MTLPFELLLAFSLVFCALQLAAVWRHVRPSRKAGEDPHTLPAARSELESAVSILKPINGMEDGLRENLESFFHLRHPAFELVLCFQDPLDAALPLARRLCRDHPHVDARVVVGDYREGLNPKVCNLIPGYRVARHDLVLISDANVRVTPEYLTETLTHLDDPRVGLVSHLVRGVGGRTFGADLDNGYLNGFVTGSVSMLHRLGRSCVIGKSMLMRRSDLERLGGLESVQNVLAEDYVLTQRIKAAGRSIVISPAAVDRVAIHESVRTFLRRYIRWNAMRRTIAGPAYILEPLTNPTLLAALLVGVTLVGGGLERPTILMAGLAVAAKMGLDAGTRLLLGVRLKPWHMFLTPIRDLLLAYAWVAGYWTRSVSWRGARVALGRGTRLSHVETPRAPGGVLPSDTAAPFPGT